MKWINSISILESVFLGIFFLLYLIYFIKVRTLAKKLGTTASSAALKFFLRLSYFMLLLAALLGPQFGAEKAINDTLGKDIFFAIDISKSMDATDVQPSRLEKVKFELTKLIDVLNENRLGLIVFSSEAQVIVPLTYDVNALKLFIQQLSTNTIEDAGTNFSEVIERINEKLDVGNQKNKNVKIVVLFSDGENFEEIPDYLLSQFKKNLIYLQIIGVGTTQGGTIPTLNGIKKDKNGEIITTKLNVPFLHSLASKMNGSYFRLDNEKNELNLLTKTIEQSENNTIDKRKYIVQNNRYYYFLWLALLLIALDIVITFRVLNFKKPFLHFKLSFLDFLFSFSLLSDVVYRLLKVRYFNRNDDEP